MTVLETILDLSALPDQARQELVDFYEFLAKKYQPMTESSGESPFSAFLQSPIPVTRWTPYTREALHER